MEIQHTDMAQNLHSILRLRVRGFYVVSTFAFQQVNYGG